MIEHLLSMSLAILNPTYSTDRYSSQKFIYPDVSTVIPTLGYLRQLSESEQINSRDTQIRQGRAFLPEGTTVTGDSRIVDLMTGVVWEVTGPPAQCVRATTGAVSHITCELIKYTA